MSKKPLTIAVIGGTGHLGSALGRRWAAAGYRVIIGSRSADRGRTVASKIAGVTGSSEVSGTDNLSAAKGADIVVLAVPYESDRETLEHIRPALQGKILVDTTVPLVPPRIARVQLPEEGSAGKAVQDMLGDSVRVVSAFKTVAATHLQSEDEQLGLDVLVCGNDPEARRRVIELVKATGCRGWHAGAIDNSAASEAMASVLIFMNKKYKLHGAGFCVRGDHEH